MTLKLASRTLMKPFYAAMILGLVTSAGACKNSDPGPMGEGDPYIDPVEGPVYGGTKVAVHGKDFAEGMRVRIGDSECVDLKVVSDTEINCTTTAANLGTYDVKVMKANQYDPVLTLPGAFEYLCTGQSAAGAVIWANEGGDKVVQEDMRASCDPFGLHNSVWDGSKVSLFGAKDEVVNFNLIIEANQRDLTSMTVELPSLTGPNGTVLSYTEGDADSIFNTTNREIELFYVRYLKIKGLSTTGYRVGADGDERHIPHRMRRNYELEGFGKGTWTDRPDHDKSYPDIAVPLELENVFTVRAGTNQSIWTDVYIPRNAPAGLYTGTMVVKENGTVVKSIPVELKVRNFTMPLEPTAKTMISMGYGPVNMRYIGVADPHATDPNAAKIDLIRDRHFQMAHRHKLSLIDQNNGRVQWPNDAPRPDWLSRLTGTLFTAANNYEGPGAGMGNGVYAIGIWGQWGWKGGTELDMQTHLDAWESWFQSNLSSDMLSKTERLLFLDDEPTNLEQIEQWSQWVNNNPGIGSNIEAFATTSLMNMAGPSASAPSLDAAGTTFRVGVTDTWQAAYDSAHGAGKKFYLYDTWRPGTGSLVLEDDGVSPRQMGWAQSKMGVDRWLYWDSTYYFDNKYSGTPNSLFTEARTFGTFERNDSVLGEAGTKYANGWGVLFYPGTDKVNPSQSYDINGPIASLRMKYWRRGIQDADYIALARAKNPDATQAIVERILPKALWQYGVSDPSDPTWLRSDISWQVDPNVWEQARKELADIIDGG